jgi:ankyrin repeat protein
VCRLLLSKGADVHALNGQRRTPLDYACSRGRVAIAAALIDRGARVSRGMLTAAARVGHKLVAELLLSRGADVNAADSAGNTALHEVRFSCAQAHFYC